MKPSFSRLELSSKKTDVSDPVYPDITLGKTFSVGKKIASGATGALLELSDEAGMRRDYIVKYLFGEGKKQEEDTANEAKYYSLCIAMDLNCPKAMLVRVKVTRVNQQPFEGYVIFKDYLRNAVDLSTQGWCSIPEVKKGLDFEIQKILTYAMHPGNPFQVECFTGELPERVCSNLKDLRKSKLKGVANYPFILTDLKDANWMYNLHTKQVFLVDFELQLYKGSKTNPTPPYGRELIGLLWHGIALGWSSCLDQRQDFLPLSYFKFDNSIECTGTTFSQLNYDEIPDLFHTPGCFNFGQNVLLKRQRLKLQNIPIAKLPVKRNGLTVSGLKNRYMNLKVEDMNVATMTYYEHSRHSWTKLSLLCGECEVQLSKLAGTGSTDIHVINKRYRPEESDLNWKSFSFNYRGDSTAIPLAVQLRTACCQPPITFPFGKMDIFSLNTFYLEKHYSIETQQTVLYYGTHERGFEHFIVIRPNEWRESYVSSGKFMRKLTYEPRSETIPDETHQADLELQGRIHDKFEALNRYEKIAFTYDNVVARKQFKKSLELNFRSYEEEEL